MTHLIPQQRPDKNGVMNIKWVRPESHQNQRNTAFPPVGASSTSSGELFRSFGKVFTDPAGIDWKHMSNDDVTKIADHASDKLSNDGRNANAMFDLYAEMFRNEHVDNQHVLSLLERNEVMKHVKEAFVEANGLNTDSEWTPEQYAAREVYVQHLTAYDEAKAAAEAELNPPTTGWNWG
jgi:hypothetical protein